LIKSLRLFLASSSAASAAIFCFNFCLIGTVAKPLQSYQ
jgi:hypothetical protein